MKLIPAILVFLTLGIAGLLTNADYAKINGTNLHLANIVSAVCIIVALVLTVLRLIERDRECKEIIDYDDGDIVPNEPRYGHSGVRR